jgi:MFS transporter, DHA2 family, multidrug resistance protein
VLLALIVGLIVLPWHSGEDSGRVDHVGGVLSIAFVGSLVLIIEVITNGITPLLVILIVVALSAGVAFTLRERRVANPLLDLPLLRRRVVWVAWIAAAITFGSLIAAMFVGQQFMQNVLGYSPVESATVVVASAVGMAIFGQLSGRIVANHGSRPAFLLGLALVAVAFAIMAFAWRVGTPLWVLVLSYLVVGAGVGMSATPASRSLTASMPPRRVGMGSALVDLTRDFGGAVMQATLGVLLASVYVLDFTRAFANLPADEAAELSAQARAMITSSYSGAAEVADKLPQADAAALIAEANVAFAAGTSVAYAVALALTLAALALVWWRYPNRSDEEACYADVARSSSRAPVA